MIEQHQGGRFKPTVRDGIGDDDFCFRERGNNPPCHLVPMASYLAFRDWRGKPDGPPIDPLLFNLCFCIGKSSMQAVSILYLPGMLKPACCQQASLKSPVPIILLSMIGMRWNMGARRQPTQLPASIMTRADIKSSAYIYFKKQQAVENKKQLISLTSSGSDLNVFKSLHQIWTLAVGYEM